MSIHDCPIQCILTFTAQKENFKIMIQSWNMINLFVEVITSLEALQLHIVEYEEKDQSPSLKHPLKDDGVSWGVMKREIELVVQILLITPLFLLS